MTADFKSKVNIQIRFGDTDALGHINNAKYLSYMEVSRIKYFDDLFGNSIDWPNEGFILAKAEVNFKKPIFLNDKVSLYVRASRFGTKSFDMEYAFVRTLTDGTEELVATGLTVQVTMSFKDNISIPVPAKYKTKIEAFEGKTF
jgi:acyl-CoA thioester hydrolase